ncbi:MAG: Crp/Fnr family transcriptional regulator [Nitrospira sp.]|nr:Crp/Fnr family transcriptional regulator [Nitrospira sp.]
MSMELELNQLLKSLPVVEKQELEPHLELVKLRTRQELNYIGSTLRYLYFPLQSAISVMDMHQGGRVIEVAVVGREGCYCPSVLAGLSASPTHTIVQTDGFAWRVNVRTVVAVQFRLPVFTRAVHRFSAVLFRQAVISVGCSHWHSVEQRLARWLLAHNHRTGDTIFPFTHEFLADQLGSQRSTVTEALSSFQRAGLVVYSYGKVELINIQRLRDVCCECCALTTQAIEDYLHEISTYKV